MSEQAPNNSEYLEHHPDAEQNIEEAHEIALAGNEDRSLVAEHKGALRLIAEELSEGSSPITRVDREEALARNDYEKGVALRAKGILVKEGDKLVDRKWLKTATLRAGEALENSKEVVANHTERAEVMEQGAKRRILESPQRMGRAILEELAKMQ